VNVDEQVKDHDQPDQQDDQSKIIEEHGHPLPVASY
jgi:hypothetical protein